MPKARVGALQVHLSYSIKCKSKRKRNTQGLTLISLQQDQLLQFKEVQTGRGKNEISF